MLDKMTFKAHELYIEEQLQAEGEKKSMNISSVEGRNRISSRILSIARHIERTLHDQYLKGSCECCYEHIIKERLKVAREEFNRIINNALDLK